MESLALVWLFGNASCATPMLCQTKRTFAHNKKHASPCLLSLNHSTTRPLNHPHVFHLSKNEPLESAAPVSSLSCHLHARACLLRTSRLRAQSFIRFSVAAKPFPLYTRPTNDASPSKRRRRDRHNERWAKAERSRLDSSCRVFNFGAQAQSPRKTTNSCSLQQGGDLVVAEMTGSRQCGPTLQLRRLVGARGEKRHHHGLVAEAAGNVERYLPILRGLVHVGALCKEQRGLHGTLLRSEQLWRAPIVSHSVESRMNCADNNHVTGFWNTVLDASWYRVDSRLVTIDEQGSER